ncbi:MAG: hypothetical protein DRN40_03785 [Thermoplasmata archaeon]|nr:MAG: hypothetical protein DRN40_03785 [Thermoplasmata archaeon]
MIDPEEMKFLKIMEIIKRAQNLIIKVRREGGDTRKAVELLSEATYALKLRDYDSALAYAKQCTLEIIRIKKELDLGRPLSVKELESLPKEELRELCRRWGLSPIGLKQELVDRLAPIARRYGGRIPPYPPLEEIEKKAEKLPEKVEEKPEKKEVREEEEKKPSKKKEEEEGVLTVEEALKHISKGFSYLLEERRPEKCFIIFRELLKDNLSGLIFTRTNPKVIQKRYGIEGDVSIYWLTDQEDAGQLRVSHSLETLIYHIEEFVNKHNECVILLDGLEYLLGNNTFNAVMRFLRRLVDRTSQQENIFLVSLSPYTMEERDVSLLEREIIPLKLK